MSDNEKLIKDLVDNVRELRELVDFDESGGSVTTFLQGRHLWCPLPSEVNACILRLSILAEKLEKDK